FLLSEMSLTLVIVAQVFGLTYVVFDISSLAYFLMWHRATYEVVLFNGLQISVFYMRTLV
ncbi:hypothetical protein, partial [Hoylesella shahii]|uniref:hypothetical protein n=1 Tax=Hoylesella shahii TaxID=228603 RepID=UPI002353BBE5